MVLIALTLLCIVSVREFMFPCFDVSCKQFLRIFQKAVYCYCYIGLFFCQQLNTGRIVVNMK